MDTIVGGSFSTDGVMKLTIDADKIGFIKFAVDGTVIPTVDGAIDSTWGGDDSDCTFYIHRGSQAIDIEASELNGDIIFDSKSELKASYTGVTSVTAQISKNIELIGCTSLVSSISPLADVVNFTGCTALTSFIAPKATSVTIVDCTGLPVDAVKAILDNGYKMYLGGKIGGVITGTGATAIDDSQDSNVYVGLTYGEMIEAMTTIGEWTIVIET